MGPDGNLDIGSTTHGLNLGCTTDESTPKEWWWQDLARWVEDGAPQLRGTVVGLVQNQGIAWDTLNVMVEKNNVFSDCSHYSHSRPFWGKKNVPLKNELLWEIECEAPAHCLDLLQVEDTLGNGMILDLLKEVDGNGDGVIDFQAQSCRVCRGTP